MSQVAENYIRSLEMSLSTIDQLLGQFEQQIADEAGPRRSALREQVRDLLDERQRLVTAIQKEAAKNNGREFETVRSETARSPRYAPHAAQE